jgi:hypothetical protein
MATPLDISNCLCYQHEWSLYNRLRPKSVRPRPSLGGRAQGGLRGDQPCLIGQRARCSPGRTNPARLGDAHVAARRQARRISTPFRRVSEAPGVRSGRGPIGACASGLWSPSPCSPLSATRLACMCGPPATPRHRGGFAGGDDACGDLYAFPRPSRHQDHKQPTPPWQRAAQISATGGARRYERAAEVHPGDRNNIRPRTRPATNRRCCGRRAVPCSPCRNRRAK